MRINYDKCGIIAFKNRGKKPTVSYRITGTVKQVKEYKYLGSYISEDYSMEENFNSLSAKIKQTMHKMTPIRTKLDLKVNSNLFRTYIIPQIKLSLILAGMNTKTGLKDMVRFIKVKWK
jgi:hypothetical protein